MKKTAKVILGSAMTMAMCASLIAGSTLALFSTKSETDIAITSAKVDVVASVSQMYTASDASGASLYSWKEASRVGDGFEGNFGNAGSVARYTEGRVELNNIAPGDAVKFTLDIENKSTIAIQYQVRATVTADNGGLFTALNFSIDGAPVTATGSVVANAWTKKAPDEDIDDVEVEVEFPASATEHMNETCELKLSVLAVQGNANVEEATVDQLPDSQGSATVPEENHDPVDLETKNHFVKVEVPAENVESDVNQLKLTVTKSTEEEQKNFAIDEKEGTSAAYYDISVDGVAEEAEEGHEYTVSIFAGKGLRTVQVYHWVDGKAEYVENVDYDSETGFVTFKTKSFSPFAVVGYTSIVPDVAPSAPAVDKGAALQKALTDAKAGDTVTVPAGDYELEQAQKVGVAPQPDGWLFAIAEDNVTVKGYGATIVAKEDMVNGNWDRQNVVTIFGNNVTLEGFTIKSKGDTNKSIEIVGKNVTLRDINVVCGEEDGNDWGGSIIFNTNNAYNPDHTIGNALFENVTVEKAFVSASTGGSNYNTPNAGKLTIKGLTLNYAGAENEHLEGYGPLKFNAVEVDAQDVNVKVSSKLYSLPDLLALVPENTTLELGEGTYSVAANETLKLTTNNVTIKGAGAGTTVIDAGAYSCSGQSAFAVEADNVTLEGLTVRSAATSNNVAVIKASRIGTIEALPPVENFTLRNVEIIGSATGGYGANLHGVQGATVDHVTIGGYGKSALAFAQATGVRVSNVTTEVSGWHTDICFNYSGSNAAAYGKHCEVSVDFASCTFANGNIYSERPTDSFDGSADVITDNGRTIADKGVLVDNCHVDGMTNNSLVMTVAENGMWAIGRKATFEVSNSEGFVDALNKVNAGKWADVTISLAAGTYKATATNQFQLLANNAHIVGENKETTVIDGDTFDVDGYGAFVVGASGCSVENVTVRTSSADANVAALKVGSTMAAPAKSKTINIVNNTTLTDLILVGKLGHGLNMHGVNGATVDNLSISGYKKCAISFAMATDVHVSNVTTENAGWGDIGMMYKEREVKDGAKEADNVYAYLTHSDVTVDFDSCNFGLGFIYSERPVTNDGDNLTDIIRGVDGTALNDQATVGELTMHVDEVATKVGKQWILTTSAVYEAFRQYEG